MPWSARFAKRYGAQQQDFGLFEFCAVTGLVCMMRRLRSMSALALATFGGSQA